MYRKTVRNRAKNTGVRVVSRGRLCWFMCTFIPKRANIRVNRRELSHERLSIWTIIAKGVVSETLLFRASCQE